MTFDADFSHLQGHQIAKRLFELSECLSQIADEQTALSRRHLSPGFESCLSCHSNALVSRWCCLDHRGDCVAGCRVVRNQIFAMWISNPAIRSAASPRIHRFEVQFFK